MGKVPIGPTRSALAAIALVTATSAWTGCGSTDADTGAPSDAGPEATGGTPASGGIGGSAGNSEAGSGGAGGQGGTAGPSGGASGVDGSTGCVAEAFAPVGVALALVALVDRSGSMSAEPQPGATVWAAVKQGMIEFVTSPESDGIAIGLQFFPPQGPVCPSVPPCPPGCTLLAGFNTCYADGTMSCDVNDYLPLAVGIDTLPATAQQVIDAMNATSPYGGTPTRPAMEAIIQASVLHAQQTPAHRVAVVLVTDGEPNDCNSDIPGVAAVAATGAAAIPPVNTFVVQIGGNLVGLDQIAQAGGTGSALVVNPTTAGSAFRDAMTGIRDGPRPCEYLVPPKTPSGQSIDPARVELRFTPSSGAPRTVSGVDGFAACDPGIGGWYYDDPIAPAQITICPAICQELRSSGGTVELVHGCS